MTPPTNDADPLGRYVRATLASVRLGEVSDGELVTRFAAARDEAAFAELVRRLGPMVYATCRRVLRTVPDAEDAYQVAFLVLARKAGGVRPPGRVAAWLHGVAVLSARKARAARARRLVRETTGARAPDPVAPAARRADPDLAEVLDAELQRLPERYRAAVVMCDVRELTVAQTAAGLGWPVGTVASRLSRGRALLAARLARRGLAVGGAGLLAGTAAARVPARLFDSTVTASAKGSAPAVAPLLHEVLRAMTLNKLRFWAAAAALCAVVAFGASGVTPPRAVAQATKKATPPAPAVTPTPEPANIPAADPLTRVKAEHLSALLSVEAIRQDVGLTADQATKLAAAQAAAKTKKAAFPQIIQQGGLPNGGQFKVSGGSNTFSSASPAANPELDAAIAGLLTSAQVRRLKQVSLQATGPAALLDRRVIRTLGLSADQEDRIEAVLPPDPRQNAGASSRVVVNGVPMDPAAQRIDAGWDAALKVLTTEQRAKWDGLVGRQLPTADLQQVHAAAAAEAFRMFGGLPNFDLPALPGFDPNLLNPQP